MRTSAASSDNPGIVNSLALSPLLAMVALALGGAGSLACLLVLPADAAGPGVLLAFALAWASLVDADRFILPDAITLGLVLAGLGVHAARGEPLQDYSVGAMAGYLSLALLAWTYQRLRKRAGLGMGDAKLLASVGAWLGWQSLPLVMLGASLSALVWASFTLMHRGPASLSAPVPFGPFLAIAFFVGWLLQH